jgi:hypothetical protein
MAYFSVLSWLLTEGTEEKLSVLQSVQWVSWSRSKWALAEHAWQYGCIRNFRDWCCHLYSSCSSMMQRLLIDNISISWESLYKISHSSVYVLISYVLLFGLIYLDWCDFVMNLTKEKHQILCKSLKDCDGDPGYA